MKPPRRNKRPAGPSRARSPLERKEYEATVAVLARAVSSGAPAAPARLRRTLLARVRQEKAPPARAAPAVQVWRSWQSQSTRRKPSLVVRRAGEGGWERIDVPGVSVRPLNVDPARRYVTMLVRMEPGSAYPEHLHAGHEECYVLEGRLRVGKDVLQAGDYQYAAGGSEHGVQSTDEGCLLLIVSSQDDELL